MEEKLKQVWVAAAAVETLQVEMDQAKALLQAAIREAAEAGADPDAISSAANLKSTESGVGTTPLAGELA